MADTQEKKTYLIDFKDNLAAYAQRAADAKKQLDAFKEANKDLLKTGDQTTAQYQQAAATLKVLENEQRNATKLVQESVKANNAQKNSYEELLRRQKLAEVQLKLMGDGYVRNKDGVLKLSDAYIKQSKIVADGKQALLDFNKEINNGTLNVGRYGESISGAFGLLPAPLRAAEGGVKSFGKSLLALLANPIVAIIAAIVAVLFGLYKVFVSTAEGANKLKEVMASIHAVLNVLRERLVNVIDAFKHLFHGEFKLAAEDMKAAFTGIAAEIKNAANAAAEFARAQAQLTKEMAFHITEEAKEQNLIQKYLYLSKDRALLDKQRVDYLKEAMRLGAEQAGKEVEYAQRQSDIDIGNAALKANIDAKTLKDWIAMDADKQNTALKGSAQLQKAYNLLGVEGVRALEESYAKITEADTAFYEQNKRAKTQISTLLEEMRKERLQDLQNQVKDYEIGNKILADAGKVRRAQLKADLDKELDTVGNSFEQREKLQMQYEDNIAKLDAEERVRAKALLKIKYEADIKDEKLTKSQLVVLHAQYLEAIDALDFDAQQKAIERAETDRKRKLGQSKEDIKAGLELQKLKAEQDGKTGFETNDALNKVLDQEYGAMLASVEYEQLTTNQKLLIDQQYTDAKRVLAENRIGILMNEKTAVAGALGAMSKVVGEQTALGKVFAVAEATINTWVAASQALADKTVPSTVARVALMVGIIATGLANVRNILAVNTGGSSSSGGGRSSTTIPHNPALHRVAMPATGANALQPSQAPAAQTAASMANMLTAESMQAMLKGLPAPIVTVEDINAKTTEVKKVKVRATI
jgi:hypothetical protein